MNILHCTNEFRPFSIKEFQNPPACFQPVYNWIWNDVITEEGIRARLHEMKEAGILAAEILPESKNFRPFTMRTNTEPDYMTEEYLRLYRYALSYADSIGITMWIYDEDGWPSGYAGGRVVKKHPEMCEKYMVQLDDGSFARDERTENTMRVDWAADGIGEAFLQETHENYARALGDMIGSKVHVFFTDEPGMIMPAYPKDMEEKFRKEYGYDPTPYLAAVYDESNAKTPAEKQARIDWCMLLGKMFRQNYLIPLREWCRKHGCLSAGHLCLENQTDACKTYAYGSFLAALRDLDLPGIDTIWRQIHMPKGSESPAKEGNEFFPRLASSAAAQIGKRLAVSESFAIYGSGLSYDEMRYLINYQAARGINVFNNMQVPYSVKGTLGVNARPSHSRFTPGSAHIKAFTLYTARLCALMSMGESGSDTALYLPARDLLAGKEERLRAMESYDTLGKKLEQMHIDFDIIDDEAIRLAVESDHSLGIGLANYKCICVPECAYMPEDVKKKIAPYMTNPLPHAKVSGADIIVRTRLFSENEKLFFLFNQSGKENTASLEVPLGMHASLLNPERAKAFVYESLSPIRLPAGGACAILVTNEPLEEAAREENAREILCVSDFSIAKKRECLMTPEGLSDVSFAPAFIPAKTGSWKPYYGACFSGEAVYRAHVDLGISPDKNCEYRIDLGKIEETGRVLINGREAGITCFSPKCAYISGADLPESGRFTLEIETANTLSNQMVSKPVSEYFPPEQLGPYHKTTVEFEKERVNGGLYGPVKIFEIR